MDFEDIELSLLDDNPFNVRLRNEREELKQLASSLRRSGQISPIVVRPFNGRYQIVCGHRRAHAAKLIGMKTIKAEVGSFSDQQVLEMSLVENVQRRDLSDYEKGLALKRMHLLGMTYEEISSSVGYSKQHISNLVSMTGLFDEVELSKNPDIASDVFRISEHHARLLLQIRDKEVRYRTMKLVLADNLSVRDLERMIHKLRGWFSAETTSEGHGSQPCRDSVSSACVEGENKVSDEVEIGKLLAAEFELPHNGSFKDFGNLHAFGEGFSMYGYSPPSHKLSDRAARYEARIWFYQVARLYNAVIRDVDIRFLNGIALVTCYVDYRNKEDRGKVAFTVRGTLILDYIRNKWKIVHEHWSRFNEIDESVKVPFLDS